MKIRANYFLFLICAYSSAHSLNKSFVYLNDVAPTIIQELRYFSNNNFVGRVINGYKANKCILTIQAATALAKVQTRLNKKGYSLVVYDCYRPQMAVNDFYNWSKNLNQSMKQQFYPRENKKNLFKRGYIARFSGHSRGSTVDLSIYANIKSKGKLKTCYSQKRLMDKSLDMGTNYDCLDHFSYVRSKSISKQARANRKLLSRLMQQQGFKPYYKEWWHFSLRNEPFPKRYFNFQVK